MPDITTCNNSSCPIMSKCYLAQARQNPHQMWQEFKPEYDDHGIRCDYFIRDIDDEIKVMDMNLR